MNLKSEEGFTLIEVIAVLIILGILAAVAVPKYFDLADEAREKAFESALSQGMSLCTLAYSRTAIKLGGEPENATQVLNVLQNLEPDGKNPPEGETTGWPSIEGEFDFTFAIEGDDIKITAKAKPEASFEGEEFRIWNMP